MTTPGMRRVVASAFIGLIWIAPASTQNFLLDRGVTGVALALRKLSTTASLMHTTAHPDDEQGGMLAMVSHGAGARTTLLTLNRGESGDNALGPELFDALGLIRTEELRLANRYYGVDEQYFTTVVDYGFSKRLEEAIEKWGREDVIRDMVRVIRRERPLVIVSRWQGNVRDGHGQHQAAGLLSQEAFQAAGDASRFPELASDGIHPWQPLKLYMGGARENELWHVKIDAGAYDPVIGDSYANLARFGLSFQRSQNAGRFSQTLGPAPAYFVRLFPKPAADGSGKETGFFDGIDTTWGGLARTLRVPNPDSYAPRLDAIAMQVRAAQTSFSIADPSTIVPALAQGLSEARDALRTLDDRSALAAVLARKARQFEDAILAALGVEMTAIAVPRGTPEPSGPFAMFAPAPTMPPVVPGQAFDVRVALAVRQAGTVPVSIKGLSVVTAGTGDGDLGSRSQLLAPERPFVETLELTLPPDTAPSRPHVSRSSINESRYSVSAGIESSRPAPPPLLIVRARLDVSGTPVGVERVVQRRESLAPYGYALRELGAVPSLSVAVAPRQALIPIGATPRRMPVTVRVTNNETTPAAASVGLALPPGWRADPATVSLEIPPGGQAEAAMTVTATVAAQAQPHDCGLGHRAWAHLRGRLRGGRVSRPRDALPVSALDRARGRGGRGHRSEPARRLRDGRRRRGPGCDRATGGGGGAARRHRAGVGAAGAIRHHRDRYARLCRPA